MINGTGIDLDGLAEVAQRSDAVGVDSKVLLQLIEKSRHPGFSVVAMPTNADEAAAMEMLGFRWLADNAPDRLTDHGRQRAVQPDMEEMARVIGMHFFYFDEVKTIKGTEFAEASRKAVVAILAMLYPPPSAPPQPIASQPETL